MRGDGVLVDIGGSRLRFCYVDEEVLRLPETRRKGLYDDSPAIWVEPQRAEGVVGFQFERGEVTICAEELTGSIAVALLDTRAPVRRRLEFLYYVYTRAQSAPVHGETAAH